MDLLIAFRIHPNGKWQRHGQNLILEQTFSVWDLILGCAVEIKDILGSTLELKIPAKTQPGSVLRLKGRGLSSRQLPAGDLLIKVQAELPSIISPELIELIEKNRA
jgi:DnaJ-class molecular chaperone